MTITKELQVNSDDNFILCGTSYFVNKLASYDGFNSINISSALEGYEYGNRTPISTVSGPKDSVDTVLEKMETLLYETIAISTSVNRINVESNQAESQFQVFVIDKETIETDSCIAGGADTTPFNVTDADEVIMENIDVVQLSTRSECIPLGVFNNPITSFKKIINDDNSTVPDNVYIDGNYVDDIVSVLENIQWLNKQHNCKCSVYVYGYLSDDVDPSVYRLADGIILDPAQIPLHEAQLEFTSNIVKVEDTPMSRITVRSDTKNISIMPDDTVNVHLESERVEGGHNVVRKVYDEGTVKNTSDKDDIKERVKKHSGS